MLESAFVVLREAVELLLILVAVLKYVQHTGRPLNKAAYAGVLAGALVAALILLSMVGQPMSPVAEASLAVGLGVMVLSVAISMLSSGPDIESHVRDRLQDQLEGKAGPALIAVFCAIAGFREALETGIFVRSIAVEIGAREAALGVLLGLLMVGVVCLAYRSFSSRLSLFAVYRASTLLLCLIAIELLVEGLGKFFRLGGIDHGPASDALLAATTPGTSAYAQLCAVLMILPLFLVGRRWWRASARG